jgi:Cys-rich protein (TIGR01571 family)
MGDFQKGLCDCFDDCGICFCSFFCPCIQFGKNMHALDEENNFFLCCCGWLVLGSTGHICSAVFGTWARQKIRKAKGHNMDDHSAIIDFFLVYCCAPCTLAQEAHEVGLGKN